MMPPDSPLDGARCYADATFRAGLCAAGLDLSDGHIAHQVEGELCPPTTPLPAFVAITDTTRGPRLVATITTRRHNADRWHVVGDLIRQRLPVQVGQTRWVAGFSSAPRVDPDARIGARACALEGRDLPTDWTAHEDWLVGLNTLLAHTATLATVALRQMRGPTVGDALPATDASGAALARWAIAHYRAADINDPGSYRELREASTWRLIQRSPQQVRVSSDLLGRTPSLVAGYAALLRHGVGLPPLLARHRGQLREGYHRRRAAVAAGCAAVSVVEFG